MKLRLFAAGLILSLCAVTSVSAWGPKGHDIVAYTAACNMNKKALKKVEQALGGHTLMYYSSWMDNVRNMAGYDVTATWHYANVDEGETYETMRKEPLGDIATALDHIIKTLSDRRNIPDSVETVYLRFLIHLMGDLHCPMHAGRLTDRGGNDLKISFFNQPTNLHSLWDSTLIEAVRKWSYTEWRDNIDYLSPVRKREIMMGTHRDWFNETVAACKLLYMGVEPGGNYSWDYMFENYPLLESQLQKGGYRLAEVLNRLYK